MVILQGSVPAFRDIKAGDKGEDVTQIQAFLSGKGLLGGGNTGVVDAKTTKAIKAWQKSLNEPQDGSIQIGDVIFVPTLPTAIAVDPKLVARGFTLAGGERAINTLGLTPRFSMNVTPQQASLIKAGTRIEISNSTGGVWDAYVAQTRSTVLDANSGGGVSLELVGKDGVPICGADCGSILAGDPQLFTSRVIISEPVNGLTVPTAALRTNADNEIIIVDNHGTNHVVKVLASAQGMSVISGVAAGMKVRLASNG